MTKCRRLGSLFLAVILVLAGFGFRIPTAEASVPWPDTLYFRQTGKASCTLASAVMMIRARTYLCGNDTWGDLTEQGMESVAWIDKEGLRGSFTYSWDSYSISVTSIGATGGVRADEIKGLLDEHPEGIVLYCGGRPHAVFITDYEGDTFYCADPAEYYYGKRITLASSSLGAAYGSQAAVLSNVTRVWIVSSYSIDSTSNRRYPMSGVYVIHSALNDNFCLDITGHSTSQNANIRLYERTDNEVQKFRLIRWDSLRYCVKSVFNGLWLDAATPLQDNSNVKLFTTNTGDENYWYFENAGDGFVYIRNKSGLCLDVQGSRAVNDANVQLYHFTGNNDQKWRLEDVTKYAQIPDGVYTVESGANSGYRLDIAGDSTENNANIQLYHATNSVVQQFRFISHGNYYTIQSVHSGKWLDIKLPAEDHANVKLYETGTSPENRWTLEDAGNGCYYFRSGRDFYLDVEKDAITDNSNIQMYHFAGSNIQKWKPVQVIPEGMTEAGLCGEKLNWAWDGNGTLTIYGSGDMYNYESEERPPWHKYSNEITTVVVEPGVTGIGEYAFNAYKKLATVTMADSVTMIGGYAFRYCTALKNLTLSAGLQVIDDCAFEGCREITTVTLPAGLAFIGDAAFASCALTSVELPSGTASATWDFFYPWNYIEDYLYHIRLPAGVTEVGEGAFCENPLPHDNPDFVIPSEVTRIEAEAFYGTDARFVWITDNVDFIDVGAFAGCTRLEFVYAPYWCEYVGMAAFPAGATIITIKGFDSPVTPIAEYAETNGNRIVYFENPYGGNG